MRAAKAYISMCVDQPVDRRSPIRIFRSRLRIHWVLLEYINGRHETR